METSPAELPGGVVLRPARLADAAAVLAAYERNRKHLEPFEPRRRPAFYTLGGQQARLSALLEQRAQRRAFPYLLVDSADDGAVVVGTITLSGIVYGPFRSANLGYWVDARYQGRGLATGAVRHLCRVCADELGLHRLEAGTLLDNLASQRVLLKCGFERIGTAPRYLQIDGSWRDHHLFQRILHDNPPEA